MCGGEKVAGIAHSFFRGENFSVLNSVLSISIPSACVFYEFSRCRMYKFFLIRVKPKRMSSSRVIFFYGFCMFICVKKSVGKQKRECLDMKDNPWGFSLFETLFFCFGFIVFWWSGKNSLESKEWKNCLIFINDWFIVRKAFAFINVVLSYSACWSLGFRLGRLRHASRSVNTFRRFKGLSK